MSAGVGAVDMDLQHTYIERMDGWSIERVLRSDVASLVSVTAELEKRLAEGDVPHEVVYACSLALEEIFTNILRYAYADAEAHEVRFAARLTDDHVVLRFEDGGRAFDPLAAKPPDLRVPPEERPIGGLGIHLVRKIAEEIEYERAGGLNRLTVRIAVRPKA